ncbi:hypothetical protein P20652_2750 [Pseudoalteromonas sp. BSi20652]|nr:hypothetical protein P20652_2750 [Pseudoalteromonas sp. BSi20652]
MHTAYIFDVSSFSYTYDYLSDKINKIAFLGFDTDKTSMVNNCSQKVQL